MDTYCKIYVSGFENKNELLNSIEAELNLSAEEDSSSKWYSIYAYKNDSFDGAMQLSFPDGFLYFRFCIDVTFDQAADVIKCKILIDHLLLWLWRKNISAIAACDYEDILLNKGGYKCSSIPFPG